MDYYRWSNRLGKWETTVFNPSSAKEICVPAWSRLEFKIYPCVMIKSNEVTIADRCAKERTEDV